MEKRTQFISGLIVVMFAIFGTAAFYPYYVGSDRCTLGGVGGLWEPVTEVVYFNDTFPAIGRYYCDVETEMSNSDCFDLDGLLNVKGCKWGGKTSKTNKTLYVMEDPPLELAFPIVKQIKNCKNVNESFKKTEITYKIVKECQQLVTGEVKENVSMTEYVCRNVTKEIKTLVTDYRLKTICKPYIEYKGGMIINYTKQGYNCTPYTDYAICDSVIDPFSGIKDGNGDGKCANYGGETCVMINSSGIYHKNGVVGWDEQSAPIPVKKVIFSE